MTSALASVRVSNASTAPLLDARILAPALALLLTGYVAITSASVEYAAANYGDPFYHSSRHLMPHDRTGRLHRVRSGGVRLDQ